MSSSSSPSPPAPPTIPSSKSSVAQPKITPHEVTGVEMSSMATDRDAASSTTTTTGIVGSGPVHVPVGEDIMQLARLGEVATVQKLFDAKKFDANYKDEEGITPLHWAAINNQYAMCKFLLDAGADVNAKGGESVATPAMWAAQRCHYYIVNLLLQHGADPLVTDVQGYNILHLATIDGNAFLLVLLLHQEIPVDVVDQQGHTGLMWAAYKGYPTCVDLFLRWGANVNAADEGGLTPLHWALVKGSVPCIQKLLDYGADRYTKTRDGKTPSTVANEMNTSRQWYRALDECGYNMDGSTKIHPFGLTSFVRNKSVLSKFFFLWPFLMVFVGIYILSYMPVFAAVPIGAVVVFALQWVAQQVANRGPSEYRVLQKTPFLSGVFAASLFWTAVTYVLKVLPATYSSFPFLNLFFSIFCALTFYFYTLSMVEDPGYIPKLVSKNQQKTVISQLFDLWKFDEENFCVYCMIRKPLRSKHCRRCNRCVAKHDHHCPWIDNCVGANNLRHFVLYIISLEVGIVLFVQLVINYIQLLPEPVGASCNIINDMLCSYMVRDTFTIVLAFWDSLQLIWVTMLCAVQLVQVARNQTTYENMRGHHIEKAPQSTQAFAAVLAAGASNLDAAGLSGAGRGPNPAITDGATPQPPRQHHHRRGFLGQWTTLLGIDAFFATARDGLRDGPASVVSRPRNPYSRGIITNCRDFWCDPAPIFGKREPGSGMIGGELVSYYRMYETPLRMHRGGGGGSRGGSGGAYTSLANDDPEANY